MFSTSYDSVSVTIAHRSYPLDIEFVAKELFWGGLDRYADEHSPRGALANVFAKSTDYRLREVAAQSAGLTRPNALRLSKDACYSIRNHISQNRNALELLPAQALILLGQSDHSIAANLVSRSSPFDEETRKDLAVKFIQHYSKDEAFKVRDILTSLKQQSRRSILAETTKQKTEPRVHVSFENYEDGIATLNCADMKFVLTSDEVTSIMDHLKTNVPKFARHIASLLNYPDPDVLDYIAQFIVTDPEHLERLIASNSRRIGRSALNNEAANRISSRALKAFFGSDVAMIEDVLTSNYDVLQTRIAQMYRHDPNPAIREVVQRYDLQAKARKSWLDADEDEFENDDICVQNNDFDETVDDDSSTEASSKKPEFKL